MISDLLSDCGGIFRIKRLASDVRNSSGCSRRCSPRLGISLILLGLLLSSCTLPDIKRGDRLAAEGRWDDALAVYRQAAKKDPFNRTLQQRLQQAKTRAAVRHYDEGRRLLKENRMPEALQELKTALGLDPSREEYHTAVNDVLRIKEAKDQLQTADKLEGLGRLDEALDAYERAVEFDPGLTEALKRITAITEQQHAAKPFGNSAQPITLRFQNAKLKEVFEVLARAGGINVLFDREVRDDPVTIFIKDTPFEDALNPLLNLNGLFARRIGPNTLLVAPNTKPKQEQYQDQMIRTFYLSNSKAKEMINLVRIMLESKRVYVNEQLNALVIRDTPAKLQLAERLIQANDRREPEVELDVEVLEVNRTKSQQYGLNFAKAIGAAIIPPGFTGGISTSPMSFTYRQLTSLGPNSYLFSLPASVLLDFFKQESDAKTLASPKLRVINGKQASVNVGEKQPVLLSTTNVLPGQAVTGAIPTTSTVTSIEFKDTGVKLTVEPTIHLADEVTLKLKIEVTRIGDLVALQANPEIKQFRFGTRMAETTLNLKADEVVVLAGLIQDEERKTRVTVPGLGDVPVLGKLFSTNTQETITTEVVLTITPHVIRNLVTPSIAAQSFWSGTEAAYATTPLFSLARPTAVARDPMGKAASNRQPAITDRMEGSTGVESAVGIPGERSPSDTAPAPVSSAASPTPDAIVAQSDDTRPGNRSASEGTDLPDRDSATSGSADLSIRPQTFTSSTGQEFRLELLAERSETLAGSQVLVRFDPQDLEFQQALPGTMTPVVDLSPGQLSLVVRPNSPEATPGQVAATLIFRTKRAGEFRALVEPSAGTDHKIAIVTQQ